ncbi:MAG: hypothetical protein ABL998_19500 [Planctomycetota bacterium]
MICLLVPHGIGYLLARAGLDKIRSGWPGLYGVGSAVCGIWLVPLVFLNLVVGAVLTDWLVDLEHGQFIPVWAALAYGLAALSFDAWWIHRQRVRILDELTNAAAAA